MCFGLQSLDFSGSINIDDAGMMLLPKGSVKQEEATVVVGLKKLKYIKLNGLVKITDHPLMKLCEQAPELESLEISKCEGITEFAI